MHNMSLIDDFEINAIWTIEENNIEGIVGKLQYSQNKILLSLPNINNLDLSQTISNVYGKTTTKVISLFNLRVVRKSTDGLANTNLIADYMIIDSKTIESIDSFKVKSGTFSFDYLPLLFNKTSWKSDRTNNEFSMEEIKDKIYKIKELDAILTEKYTGQEQIYAKSKKGLVITLKTVPYLKIEYNEEQSILKIKNDIYKIRNLLSILCGEALTLTSFSFDSECRDVGGGLMSIKGNVFFPQLDVKREYKQFSSAYNYDDIIDNNFEMVLSKYFEYYKNLKPIVQNITINMAVNNLAESQFHDAITSLEVYHREFCKEFEKTTSDIEKMKQQFITIIEENHQDEYERIELIEMIKDIDRVNLRKRVTQLLRDIPISIKEKINYKDLDFTKSKKITDFAYKCSNTRNYHAHGSTKSTNKIFESTELIYVTRILSLISEYYLMKQIGISDEIILKSISNKKIYQVVFIEN